MAIISKNEKERLVKAIISAEEKTSGEIRVHIQKKLKGNVYEAAEKKFMKLKMQETAQRNGILIYIALKNREFAIIGDSGIHEKVGDSFWNETVEKMGKHFREDSLIDGIEKGIEIVGVALKKYFPHLADDKNELSNEVTVDE